MGRWIFVKGIKMQRQHLPWRALDVLAAVHYRQLVHASAASDIAPCKLAASAACPVWDQLYHLQSAGHS